MKLVELLLSFTKPHEAQPESAFTADKWSNETLTQAQLAVLRKTPQPCLTSAGGNEVWMVSWPPFSRFDFTSISANCASLSFLAQTGSESVHSWSVCDQLVDLRQALKSASVKKPPVIWLRLTVSGWLAQMFSFSQCRIKQNTNKLLGFAHFIYALVQYI